MARNYRLFEGSIQDQFQKSRAKIQMFAGGFANGKTTSMVVKGLMLARDYPGSNGLIARSTYPKLNDTIRKVWIEWCPKSWIESFPKKENICTLTNGTTVNFRYVQQNSGGGEDGSSNLLSATYDWIIVDQIEDPEFVEKDFDDLLGRLRGVARYIGDDKTMPETGPRWMLISCNPTRNWTYRKLVKPYHEYKATGRKTPDLLVDPESGKCIIEVFEGSTYSNKENLPSDYIRTLESAYQGQMRERFLLGQWAAYEGLIYPEYSPDIHKIPYDEIRRYISRLRLLGYSPYWRGSYDLGIRVPSCFLLGFADDRGNEIIIDGFYQPELSIFKSSELIKETLNKYGLSPEDVAIYGDPSMFKRTAPGMQLVGRSTTDMFLECGVRMRRGNNDIINGIQKVKSYLAPSMRHRHVFTNTIPGSHLYFSDHLDFLHNEITDYYWKRDTQGDGVDRPQDKNDHAMDALKYFLTSEPELAEFVGSPTEPPAYMQWHEFEDSRDNSVKPRGKSYG